MPDGTVRGRFVGAAHQPGGANRWSGALRCLAIDGNTAWIGGIYEHATNPALIGNGFVFKVVDNGEGALATPDFTSRAMRGGSDCTLRPEPDPAFWYPVEAGNIQIHQ
jgi:hypothetical protein